MRLGRLTLVVATLVAILVFPMLLRNALSALQLPSAYAATNLLDADGRVYQNGNNDDNDNKNNNNNNNNNGDDDDDDDDGEDNDNDECYTNLNANESVPCDDEDNGNYSNDDNGNYTDNNNDDGYVPPPPPSASAPAPAPRPVTAPGRASARCYGAGETGDLMLVLDGGRVTMRAVPPLGLVSATRVQLDRVDPVTVPAPPAGVMFLDSLVWNMTGLNGCDGPSIGSLPNDVNVGISYTVPADKAKLQIVYLRNGAWVELPTTPDPSQPYISATARDLGIYAVIQKP